MVRQFDVCRLKNGTLVVVLQHDLLGDLRSRVVAPLLPLERAGGALRGLTLDLDVGGTPLRLMPQLMATLTLAELGPPVTSLGTSRDAILRACDVLLCGV